MKLRDIDLFPDRKDDAMVISALAALAVGVGAHTFIGPAHSRAERLQETQPLAVMVLGALFPGWGLSRFASLVYGRGKADGSIEGEQRGINIGYQIPNPALAPARDALAGAATGVQIAKAATDLIGEDRLPAWAVPVAGAIEKAETVLAPPVASTIDAPDLPAGWEIDDDGRLRDEHGRYAKRPKRKK